MCPQIPAFHCPGGPAEVTLGVLGRRWVAQGSQEMSRCPRSPTRHRGHLISLITKSSDGKDSGCNTSTTPKKKVADRHSVFKP